MTLPVHAEQPQRLTRKPEEAAPMLGVGRCGVYELIRTGKLRSIRVGRKILVPLSAIDDFLSGTK
ncbi:helix-turn-helix domain-containing protein [Deinococcus marmoris]|uniref:helix-turn-helix domain-containing protein n=1 Tax=Deinococcus marmoris TaxID=249408 RepID=UPI000496E159|nr:helix-turn-helix domain-containing protein [Deinococcus marmoris]